MWRQSHAVHQVPVPVRAVESGVEQAVVPLRRQDEWQIGKQSRSSAGKVANGGAEAGTRLIQVERYLHLLRLSQRP